MAETFPPGDPQGIWEIADGLDARAKTLTSASDQLLALRKIPWYSEAGDAYRTHITKQCKTMNNNATDITKGTTILRTFGKYLLDLQREYAELEQQRAGFEKTLTQATTPTPAHTTAWPTTKTIPNYTKPHRNSHHQSIHCPRPHHHHTSQHPTPLATSHPTSHHRHQNTRPVLGRVEWWYLRRSETATGSDKRNTCGRVRRERYYSGWDWLMFGSISLDGSVADECR